MTSTFLERRLVAGVQLLRQLSEDEVLSESQFVEKAMEVIDDLAEVGDETVLPKEVLAEAVAKQCLIKGDFLLRSGQRSEYYFDKYRFEAVPRLLREVVIQMCGLIPEGTTLLAGLEMGGIPIATMLSQYTGIPTCFVRKKAKEHGTCLSIEGIDPQGEQVCIIEDVVTSGGAVFDAVADLRANGAEVYSVVCAIARWSCKLDTSGAVEEGPEPFRGFDARHLHLFPLFTLNDLDKFIEEAKQP